jgi:hypothetical protein
MDVAMPEHQKPDDSDHLSPEELQRWSQQEQADLAKAVELRTKEVRELATAYSAGTISPEEAEKRLYSYNRRWGEALPGTHAAKGATDEEILTSIDESRSRGFTRLAKRTDRAIE